MMSTTDTACALVENRAKSNASARGHVTASEAPPLPAEGSFRTVHAHTRAPSQAIGSESSDADATIHIAVAQILPSEEGLSGPRGALTKVAELARWASHVQADVLVLPEYFSGATHDSWRAVRKAGAPRPAPHDEVGASYRAHKPLLRAHV